MQGVLVVYPHTTQLGFRDRRAGRKWAVGIPVRFWGKDSLFRVPLFGRWLRWLGGVPVSALGAPRRGRADDRP